MKYMMFIKHPETIRVENVPPALMEAMGNLVQKGFKNGTIVDTAGLKPTAQGKRVQLRGGRLSVKDGPFTETKEIIGGYAIMNLKSDKEALEAATEFMELHRIHWPEFEGECELRPVEDQG